MICQPFPKGPSGSIAPAYYLVTILYTPPGNKSKATYTDGSTAGSSTSVATMFGNGLTAGITGNVIATAGFQVSSQNSQSFQTTKTVTAGLEIDSVTDSIDHGQDQFYLWVNPVINYSQQQSPGLPINISLGTAGGANMNVIELNANELTGKETIPPSKQKYLGSFTPADFAQIASTDPWLTPGYQLDPNRFQFINQVQLDGPDNPGDDYGGEPISVSDSQTNCTTDSTSQTSTASFGGSAGIDFFGAGEKVTAVDSVSWKNTSSVGNCNGASQTAAVDPETNTVGYSAVIDVYEDTIYHSFAYVSAPAPSGLSASSADISGTVKDTAGKPLAHQLIVARFADGVTRSLYSNAQGNYRIFLVPPGALTISTGGEVRRATFVAGRPIVQPLTVRRPAGLPKPLPVKPRIE